MSTKGHENVTAAECSKQASNKDEVIAYITAEIAIAIVAFVSNSFVLIAVIKFKYLRTRTYTLLASLAVADIGVALFAIPNAIVLRIGLLIHHDSAIQDSRGLPVVGLHLCFVMISSVIFLTQVSIFSLLVIAVDRFVAIYHSLRYRAIVTRSRVKVGISGAWTFGAIIGFLPQLGWNNMHATEDISNRMRCCAFEKIINMKYMVYFNFFVCVLPPLAIMFILYFLVFRSAKKQLRKIYSDVKVRRWRLSKNSLVSLRDALQPNLRGAFLPLMDRVRRQSKSSLAHKGMNEIRSEAEITINVTSDELDKDLPVTEATLFETNSFIQRDEHAEYRTQIQRSASTPKLCLRSNEFARSRGILRRVSSLSDINFNLRRHTMPNTSENELRPERTWTSLITHTPATSGMTSKISTLPRESESRRSSADSFVIGRLYSNASSYVASNQCEERDRDNFQRRRIKRKSQLLRKEFRAARSLFTVVGMFAVCWLPLHVINCVTLFCPSCFTPSGLKDFAILLSHANSLVNPIIYAFQLRDMKQAFQKIIKDICSCCFRSKGR